MTKAICIKCGEEKSGAFVPCSACGYQPNTDHDLTYSMALSTHHQTESTLRALGSGIKSGKIDRIVLPPDQEAELLAQVKQSGIRKMTGIVSSKEEENEGVESCAPMPLWTKILKWVLVWGIVLFSVTQLLVNYNEAGYSFVPLVLAFVFYKLANWWITETLSEPKKIWQRYACGVILGFLSISTASTLSTAAEVFFLNAELNQRALLIALGSVIFKTILMGIMIPTIYLALKVAVKCLTPKAD